MLKEFLIIYLYLLLCMLISLFIVILSMLIVYRTGDIEKVSAYECGFHPFEDSRTTFDVKFYMVGILFIIFDLEITFLFPWAISLNFLDCFGFFSMFIFGIILLIGFIYEWKNSALEWV